MQESKTLHYILGISLVMIAVFVVASLVMINSQAADNNITNTTVGVNDVAPTLMNLVTSSSTIAGTGITNTNDSTFATGGITLTSGGNVSLFLNGMVTDANGNNDITAIQGRIWRNSNAAKTGQDAGSTCTSAAGHDGMTKNNCFFDVDCNPDTNSPGNATNQKRFSCAFVLPFYTAGTAAGAEFDNTTTSADDYVAEILVTSGSVTPYVTVLAGTFDTPASTANGGTGSVRRINTLLSLAIPQATIDYGTLAVGDSLAGGATKPVTIAQAGNDVADVFIYAPTIDGNLACTILGTIPGSQQKFSQIDGADYAAGTTIPMELNSTTTLGGYSIGYKPDNATTTNDTGYANIKISNNVAGTCAGKLNFITTPV